MIQESAIKRFENITRNSFVEVLVGLEKQRGRKCVDITFVTDGRLYFRRDFVSEGLAEERTEAF